ncbi:hypothetical protein GGR21_003510 [Dysgonomonas hofstadii]|uniref:Membrane protein 6-pyruvoyl-tetrahydropterin synthase-related domain-containing protein n=1 Tax=Dysgonomonas hofstadii TaxID=637886 RepID=A0A840CNL2_9BACT|nr:YfhO family protein [Dysgonomonas hofstadii]MBB4037590.1 hypothetical protein [Dysgonomonas hofstadii]
MTETSLHNKTNKKTYRIFLIVLFLLSLFMVWWTGPVSDYGGHDYFFHLRRFNVLVDALRDGEYPIYLDYENIGGYGYFTKIFYPDLILLPFALLSLLTGVGAAYNVMLFIMTFLCGIFTYKLISTIFSNSPAAFSGALLYTFSAYRLFDLYQRGALGEALSFTFLPLVLLGLFYIISGDYRKWYVLAAGYSLVIYTHVLSSFMVFVLLFILCAISYKSFRKEPVRLGYLLLAAIVTVGFTASYIFPMLEQMASNTFYYENQPNITGQNKLGAHRILWGFVSGFLYPQNSPSCGVGLLLTISACLRIFIKEKSNYLKIADGCLIIGVTFLIIMSSVFPWGRLPLGFIQFPSRFYLLVSMMFAIAGSYYLSALLKSKSRQAAGSVILVIFTIAVIILSNKYYTEGQIKARASNSNETTDKPIIGNWYNLGWLEYLPEKVPSIYYLTDRGDSITALNESTSISDFQRKGRTLKFSVTSSADTLELPLTYYKGYKAFKDRQPLVLQESQNGLVEIAIRGNGRVNVFYEWTFVQEISLYISLICIFVLITYIFVWKRKAKKQIPKE